MKKNIVTRVIVLVLAALMIISIVYISLYSVIG